MSPAADPRLDAGLPLAVSVVIGKRFYDPEVARLSGQVQVLLDGEPIGRCIAYDVPAGTVTRTVRDALGRVIVSGGEIQTEVLRGKVEARWVQPAGAVSRG